MPTENRTEALRLLLLSLAQEQSISDELLAEALVLLKKPMEHFSVAEYKLNQLLDELLAGTISAQELARLWMRIKLTDTSSHAESLVPKTRTATAEQAPTAYKANTLFIAILLTLIAIIMTYWKWDDYRFWLLHQQGFEADRAVEEIRQSRGQETRQNAAQGFYARQYVNEGINLASMAKVSVTEYYMSMGVYPNDNKQAGLAAPSDIRGDGVDSVSVSEGGVITIRFNHLVGENKTLTLTPSSSGNGPVVWNCTSDGLPAETLPPHCR